MGKTLVLQPSRFLLPKAEGEEWNSLELFLDVLKGIWTFVMWLFCLCPAGPHHTVRLLKLLSGGPAALLDGQEGEEDEILTS